MIHTIDLNFQGIRCSIAAFLVETSIGPVLVECGPYSTFDNLQSGVEKIGYDLSDIKHVFLSHIHFDHAGAAWALAEKGAVIHVHPIGAPHMIDPSKLVNSARRIYKDQMDELWGELKPIDKNQLITHNHGEKVEIGNKCFASWHTPGHATHHIAWQLENNLFTGDVAGVCINNGIVVPPCPPPDINLEDWKDSINLMRSLELKRLYLTHFGIIDKINDHLDNLELCLDKWSKFIKPSVEAGIDLNEIVPKFKVYVSDQLREFGISKEGIIQYETANPSDMSVAGLGRYWKKKLFT